MFYNIHIALLILVSIICSPPPKEQSRLKEVFAQKPSLIKEGSNSNLKTLKATEYTYHVSNKVIVNFEKDEVIEDHETILGTKNVPSNSYIPSYTFYIIKEKGKTLKVISHSCQKIKLPENKVSSDKCTSSFKEDDEKYNFVYNCKFGNNEQLLIKYKYSLSREKKEILYKQEDVSIPKDYSGAKCDYKFIIPTNYKSLGLKYNRLKKESDCLYSYIGNCPNEEIIDVIRFSPQKTYWKAEMTSTAESDSPISKNVTMKFIRMYKGGKNRNKNYKLTTNDDTVLNDTELITDEIFLKTELPGKNEKKVGVKLNTAFINNLNNNFISFTSDKFYDLNTNIDDTIKKKVDEIINDKNSEYKDYPDYYKIGKFLHNYMTYDLSYVGKELTPIQIYNGKRGVCEHYTLLYNTMLNAINIKTFTIVGYGFESNQVVATEKTTGHAWTGAIINGEIKQLDATWDLFEGISAAHVFKGFTKETFTSNGINLKSLTKTHNVQLIDNLDGEKEDSTYIESEFFYNKERDETEKECKVSILNQSEPESSNENDFHIINTLPNSGTGNRIKISKIYISLYIILLYILV